MNYITYYCVKCNRYFTVFVEYFGDFDMLCHICGSDDVWIQDHDCNDGKPLVMGRGGCSPK